MDQLLAAGDRSEPGAIGRIQSGGFERRWVLAALVASAATAVGAALSLWPFWDSGSDTGVNPTTGVINLLVAVSFVATAVVLGETKEYRTTALALGVTAGFWLMSWWWTWPPDWQVGPVALLSSVFGYFWFVCGGVALLRYPSTRLALVERIYFMMMAGFIIAGKIAIALVSKPEWHYNYSHESWWPSAAPDFALYKTLDAIFYIVIVVFAVLMLPLLLMKLRRTRGMDRLDSVPVIVAASAVTVCGAVYLTARVFDVPAGIAASLRTFMGIAALVTPLAFLMTVLRRRLSRSAVSDFIDRTSGISTVAHIQRELRSVLHDTTLILWVWDPVKESFIDTAGNLSTMPQHTVIYAAEIAASNGSLLAVIQLDESLRRFKPLVESVVSAAGRVLEVQAQLAELNASRKRIAAAADKERRRIERDLHDGSQASLIGAVASLRAARIRARESPLVVEAIDEARDGVHTALRELRDLVRGVHPDVLIQFGLGHAIDLVATRLPLQIDVQICEGRWHPEVETTVYYLIKEALNNAIRHSSARRADVSVVAVPATESTEAALHVEIRDDGCGGAAESNGSGLAGLRDRVDTAGGKLVIDSPLGHGTSVSAVIPCG